MRSTSHPQLIGAAAAPRRTALNSADRVVPMLVVDPASPTSSTASAASRSPPPRPRAAAPPATSAPRRRGRRDRRRDRGRCGRANASPDRRASPSPLLRTRLRHMMSARPGRSRVTVAATPSMFSAAPPGRRQQLPHARSRRVPPRAPGHRQRGAAWRPKCGVESRQTCPRLRPPSASSASFVDGLRSSEIRRALPCVEPTDHDVPRRHHPRRRNASLDSHGPRRDGAAP